MMRRQVKGPFGYWNFPLINSISQPSMRRQELRITEDDVYEIKKAIRELERKTDELYTQRKIDFNTMNEILDIIITIKHIIERLGP